MDFWNWLRSPVGPSWLSIASLVVAVMMFLVFVNAMAGAAAENGATRVDWEVLEPELGVRCLVVERSHRIAVDCWEVR